MGLFRTTCLLERALMLLVEVIRLLALVQVFRAQMMVIRKVAVLLLALQQRRMAIIPLPLEQRQRQEQLIPLLLEGLQM